MLQISRKEHNFARRDKIAESPPSAQENLLKPKPAMNMFKRLLMLADENKKLTARSLHEC